MSYELDCQFPDKPTGSFYPKFIMATFYTKDTPYEEVCLKTFLPSAVKLFFTCKAVYKIIVAENKGSWLKNVAEKPKIILSILNEMSALGDNRALVFVDADSEVVRYPILFDNIPDDVDVAYHNLDWKSWYGYKDSNVKELLSGTMFFRNNDKVKKLLTDWYERAIMSAQWEQKVLQEIINNYGLKIYELPVEYCYINTLPDGRKPLVECNPVIVHHQASRKLKRIIK